MAQSGHHYPLIQCLLLGVKRTSVEPSAMSALTQSGHCLTPTYPLPTSQFDPLRRLVLSLGETMKRRSSAGGKPAKPRGPKRSTPTRRNAPKATRNRGASIAGQETVVARLTRELSEERKQRTATSEVLHLLSRSHSDLNRLFDTILSNATKLCQAHFGTLFLCEADVLRIVAQHNAPPRMPSFADANRWSEPSLCCVWLRPNNWSTLLIYLSMWLQTQPTRTPLPLWRANGLYSANAQGRGERSRASAAP